MKLNLEKKRDYATQIQIVSWFVYIKQETFTRFDTSNYELNKPLPKNKNKKLISLMKDELGVKIMTEIAALRLKACSYLTDDSVKKKKKAQKSKSQEKN